MKSTPTRILVVSSAAERGAKETLRALAAGAIDFMKKPAASDFLQLEKDLSAKLGTLLAANPMGTQPQPMPRATASRPSAAGSVEIVAIGVSTGGPSTLIRVLKELPRAFPLPVLVAQHMPAGWTEHLAVQLAKECALDVRQASHDESVEPGRIYIAPGDFNMEVTSSRKIRISAGASRAGVRPSADLLFESVAECVGPRALAVVLTGMGNDGLFGARKIREAGGKVIAQSEATCVVYGMPRCVVDDGTVDWQGSPEEIGRYVAACSLAPVSA